ncbi:LOW QUALITY PROTEIN: ubiquitin carboxyl-terminal hydrolase CYLD-like [Leucoraja erinacea]|uniref:LOW QUALITY PROTEIN: ubiquitin carboxyl-terminal hydrolase CYLD-like n=1 Tax=Leucoraja erinaceus TaxID=7782 RepID=UPI002453AC7C|nr:LOW QUALITY PROTEIN: ubiquitin carboxyl-terminal hydrolase CYLD-like [Leucoraja erinacea]
MASACVFNCAMFCVVAARESGTEVDGLQQEQGLVQQALVNGDSPPPRHWLGVKSTVQIDMSKGPPVTGVIQWTGHLPGVDGQQAGVELDVDQGVTDGCWQGMYYFHCPPKRGIFVRLASCQPDARFQSLSPSRDNWQEGKAIAGSRESCVVTELIAPPREEEAVRVLQGRMRGIQGHCNSCYMDAALFSLFSCSMVLDSMLYKTTARTQRSCQQILREEIVNPLRRDGFVDCKKVMNLRQELTQGGYCARLHSWQQLVCLDSVEKPSFPLYLGAHDSKKPKCVCVCVCVCPCLADPEEFLNVIMQQVLGLEPLLKLKSEGHKDQECYCHQIFIDPDDELLVPTVQQLVERSFHSNHLKLAEVPSCFIIQMPRFGKSYKMFEKIIPSLELDITDLLSESPRGCYVCSELATQECEDCFKDKLFSKTGLKQFCDICWHQVHSQASGRRFTCRWRCVARRGTRAGVGRGSPASGCNSSLCCASRPATMYPSSSTDRRTVTGCSSTACPTGTVHSQASGRRHVSLALRCPTGYEGGRWAGVPRERMQLFAVLCIETSHYVSFVKYGPQNSDWMFFDSMSDRHGGESGYNIPSVTACPEVGQYMDIPPAKLAKQSGRDMAGVAKRQFCDAYMYLYQNPRMAVYK